MNNPTWRLCASTGNGRQKNQSIYNNKPMLYYSIVFSGCVLHLCCCLLHLHLQQRFSIPPRCTVHASTQCRLYSFLRAKLSDKQTEAAFNLTALALASLVCSITSKKCATRSVLVTVYTIQVLLTLSGAYRSMSCIAMAWVASSTREKARTHNLQPDTHTAC